MIFEYIALGSDIWINSLGSSTWVKILCSAILVNNLGADIWVKIFEI